MPSHELEDDASIAVEESRDIRAGCVVHVAGLPSVLPSARSVRTQVGFHRYSQ